MRRISACLISLCTAAWGQFGSLSTVHDGSVLFFTTRLAQTGTGQPSHGKLFFIDTDGVHPLAILNRDVFPAGPSWINPVAYRTNIYDLVGVDIASNGSKLSLIGIRECSGYTSGLCVSARWTTVYDEQGNSVRTFPGEVLLSRNGKWGLIVLNRLSSGVAYSVVDFDSGGVFDWPSHTGSSDWRRSSIADDGTAGVVSIRGLFLLRPGEAAIQLAGYNVGSTALDAKGTTLLAWANGKPTLYRLAAQGPPRALTRTELDDIGSAPMLTADGSHVLFLAGGQLFWKQTSATNPARRIARIPEGASSAVLSGDGRVAWALTNTGRILKISMNSGEIVEAIGPVAAFLPGISPRYPYYVPGHVVTLPVTASATRDDIVTFGGVRTPILNRSSEGITVQIPWELQPARTHGIALQGQGADRWSGPSSSLYLYDQYPEFTLIWDSRDYITRADRGSTAEPITTANPAHGGDTVSLYGTDFGPVTPPAITGVPATQSSSLTSPLVCFLSNSFTLIPTVFAGLAPGEIGVYRVDLVLPRIETAGKLTIECQFHEVNRSAWTYKATLPVAP